LLIRFWGTGEFVVANVALIKSGDDSKVTTETILSRSHKVRLTLDYDLAPDWKASITGNFADPFAELGLVEVRGQAGPIGLRAFHNGTGGNLGDPLDMFKGSKYHENNTTGLEVSMPLGAGGAQAMALMPSEGEGDPLTVVNVKMPVGDLISAQAFAVNEWSDAEEGNMALGVAAEVGLLTGQRAVGEVVLGAGEDNLAWLAKASSPLGGLADIELSSRIVGKSAMRRNDHTGGGAYGQHSLNLTVHLPSGWGPNVYAQYWHRPKGHWKDITGKVQVGGSIAGVNLTSYVQHKVRVQNEGEDWKLVADESRLFARASASPFDWLSAAAILWLEGDQAKEAVFAVPTYLGRLGVKPLDGIELNLEAAMSKETADGDSVTNLYGKVTRQIQGGSLEFSYGKPTLNSNDDKRENLKTAEGYLQMKLNIAF